MTVLDVGSGPGFFIPLLSRLVGEKGKVWAVDPDPRAIDRIKRKGLSNVEARVGSASSLTFWEMRAWTSCSQTLYYVASWITREQ